MIEKKDLAKYYPEIFFFDSDLSYSETQNQEKTFSSTDNKNTIYIVVIFTMTWALIARDWRKRKWW